MKCRNCGAEFAGNFCPKCGTPAGVVSQSNVQQQPFPKKIGYLIAAIVVIIIIFLFIKAVLSNSDKQEELTVGSSIELNDNLKVTINDADTNYIPSGDEYNSYTPSAGMKYIMVDFTYEHIGESGEEYPSVFDYECYADGTTCNWAGCLDGNYFHYEELTPGESVSFKVFYEVPIDSESIELEFVEALEYPDMRIKIQ